jgi:hypothetical protein
MVNNLPHLEKPPERDLVPGSLLITLPKAFLAVVHLATTSVEASELEGMEELVSCQHVYVVQVSSN